MVRIPAIDRSFGSLPRSTSRREIAAARRRAPAEFDVPTRGFARELAELDPEQRVDAERRDWRAEAYGAPATRRGWKLLDILV